MVHVNIDLCFYEIPGNDFLTEIKLLCTNCNFAAFVTTAYRMTDLLLDRLVVDVG